MGAMTQELSRPAEVAQDGSALRDVRVSAVRWEAEGVVSLEMTPTGADHLPDWEPGAHVDVVLPSGFVRQYSLCGTPNGGRSYRVAVLREEDGRGGSAEIHDSALVGRTVQLRGPRNHFTLEHADRYLFLAGGIGVTPILAMVRSLPPGADFKVVYGGRTRSSMAFVDELTALCGPRLTLVPQDECGLIDLDRILAEAPDGTAVYCCGPAPLLDAVAGTVEQTPGVSSLHIERFGAATTEAGADSEGESKGFEVELRLTGEVLKVGPDDVLIDVVREVCPAVMSSCEEGFCGTCETKVLEGEPEHHDTILSEKERERGNTMMICVGRSKTPRLVLDL